MNDIPKRKKRFTRAGKLRPVLEKLPGAAVNYVLISVLTLASFYLSLLSTSQPVHSYQRAPISNAISILEAEGFAREVVLLRYVATFRTSDSWLNSFVPDENAYAATNFPFEVITLYPDFFNKATDDRERAAILLHEAQHLLGKTEKQAYEYVWKNRKALGWTQMAYGTTESYVTIELQTREFCPDLFVCTQNLWNDCTQAKKGTLHLADKSGS
ncbi:MAG: hypothetical protein HKN33_06250 [Pyrinomonadaceae bacterium]|nr:hypothetical protein [Pyrinomonadaceae bacterium]